MKKRRQNLGGAGITPRSGRLDLAVRVAGYGSIGLLGVLVSALLLPSIGETSHATSCLDDPTIEGCYTTMAETEVGVTASTAISLAMSSQVNMEVIPKSNGATSSASTKLSVSTNSPDGYALYMQTGSASGDLVSTASYSESKITNTTKSNVTLSNLEPNAYGYALTEGTLDSSTTYSSLPTTGSVIKKTTSVTASEGNYAYGDTYNLAFGVNIGTNLPAGTYTGSVMLSAVANPKTIATMFDLTYMQDMTSDICTNTREGYTKQLIDTRDGKSYWVAKLKDGNCWMTQNLALDITEDGLKASDTDITHDWNAQYTGNGLSIGTDVIPSGAQAKDEYVPTATQDKITNFGMSNKTAYSWNFGQWVLRAPMLVVTCGNQTTIAACTKVGFVDVSGPDWKPTFTARVLRTGETATLDDGNLLITSTTNNPQIIAVDPAAKTYDPHYLVGNYYQFNAATASTGVAVMDKVDASASGSICPKNWKLPTSTKYSAGDFANLLSAYGLLKDFTNGYFKNDEYFLSAPPFYFNANGLVYRWGGALSSLGNTVQLYSSTVNDKDINGNDLFGGNFFDYTVGNSTRIAILIRSGGFYYGVPVRCLAR